MTSLSKREEKIIAKRYNKVRRGTLKQCGTYFLSIFQVDSYHFAIPNFSNEQGGNK